MALLILGLVLFLGTHSISIVNATWRERMVARLGEAGWKGIYALIALLGLVLIIWGYDQARQTAPVLYVPPAWLDHVAMLLLLPVFPLLLAAYLPGRIQGATKHPMLAAVKFWALAHLLSNGGLADVLLFGGFLAWAVADRISLKHRPQRPLPSAPPRGMNDLIAVTGGLILYVAFALWLHAWLIGVAPAG